MIPLKQLLTQRSHLLPTPKQPASWIVAMMGVVALFGFADSIYLTVHHYVDIPLPCSITHGCETVLTHPLSMVGSIPLAAFGIVFFLVFLVALLIIFTSTVVSKQHIYTTAILATAGALASVGFLAIQGLIIGAYCLYCIFSALCAFLLFAGAMAMLKAVR